MTTIKVQTITQYAMFEQDGITLREAIADEIRKGNTVQLDFQGVEYFTTMFFNASIGWLVLNEGPEYVEKNIAPINLSELGKSTWDHSFDNAMRIRENRDYREAVRSYSDDEDEGE